MLTTLVIPYAFSVTEISMCDLFLSLGRGLSYLLSGAGKRYPRGKVTCGHIGVWDTVLLLW